MVGSENPPYALRGLRGQVKATDGPPPEKLNGQLFVLPGVVEMPDDLGAAMRNSISQRIDVRDGAFESGDLPLGPALVVLQIAGRARAHEQVQVVLGVSELQLGAGPPARLR